MKNRTKVDNIIVTVNHITICVFPNLIQNETLYVPFFVYSQMCVKMSYQRCVNKSFIPYTDTNSFEWRTLDRDQDVWPTSSSSYAALQLLQQLLSRNKTIIYVFKTNIKTEGTQREDYPLHSCNNVAMTPPCLHASTSTWEIMHSQGHTYHAYIWKQI